MRYTTSSLYIIGSLITALALIAANTSPETTNPKHCYALISPVDENSGGASQMLESACFDTFSQAIKAATQGRVELDQSITPADVTDAMLNTSENGSLPASQVIIGIDWDYTNYGGSSNIWAANDYGCSSSIQYGVTTMPSGWDDRVSSARGYSNCNYYYHYQNTSYGGAFIVCHTGCSSMGSLDNDTSSERWTYN
ncbi:MAG TPA: hypothetical protein VMS73_01700 [Anaerolineaceae bacterium]|nr:hypothetical protein [Anaerolineaceae bacterium]